MEADVPTDGLHPTQAMWQIMVPRLIETMQDSARVKHDHDEISRALSLLKRKDDLWIVMASAFVASSWGALAGFASLTVLATGIISASRTYFKRNSASAIQLQLTPRPDNQV